MTRNAVSYVALLCTVIVFGMASVAENGSQEPAVELFLTACAASYTHAELLQREVRSRGFAELKPDLAKQYLGGAPGQAWAGTVQSKRFVIALRPEILCTIIAHDGDPKKIMAEFESWLPPPSSGISLKKQVGPASGALQTTTYELRGGKVQERWVITVSSDPASQTRAMLSWGRL